MLVDLAYVFAIIEEHLVHCFSLLYKFCAKRCLPTVTQPFFPQNKIPKQEYQSLHLYVFQTRQCYNLCKFHMENLDALICKHRSKSYFLSLFLNPIIYVRLFHSKVHKLYYGMYHALSQIQLPFCNSLHTKRRCIIIISSKLIIHISFCIDLKSIYTTLTVFYPISPLKSRKTNAKIKFPVFKLMGIKVRMTTNDQVNLEL